MHHCNLALSVVINFSHFRLLLWSGIQRILTGSKISTSSTKFVLIGPIKKKTNKKQDGRPGIWLTATLSTSPLKPLNGIQRNLKGSKISTSSTKFVVFGPIGKTRWPPRPLIDWDIFDFYSVTAISNSTKLGKKQDLNVLYQGCVFRPIEKTRWPPGFWLAETFSASPLKPMNGIQQNSQEARSQRLLSRLCFSGRSEEQDSRPGLWLAEAFSISHLKPLNWIQQNLTGRKIQCPLISLCFSGRLEEQDGRPTSDLPRHFDFSSVTAEQDSTKLDRKQNFNVLYQVRVIRRNLTGSKISMSYTKFFFFGPIRKTKWLSRPLIDWDIFYFSSERNSTKLDRK